MGKLGRNAWSPPTNCSMRRRIKRRRF